jgi:3'(2'), 5'-bisphosphate nucleotidase
MKGSLANWADYAYSLAVQAGEKILYYYEQPALYETEYKADNSPLTQADKAAHEIIHAGLSQYVLDDNGVAPVLSEEGKAISLQERTTWHRYWCVDPLDGTREFLAGNDQFAVNIALIINHQPMIGVIYAPTQKIGFMAWHEGGAYRCDAKGHRERIMVKRPLTTPVRVIISRHHNEAKVQPWLTNLGPTTLVHLGSAIKFGLLARGEADLMLRLTPTCEWDNAAGQCLLEEAGGAVLTLEGHPLTYNQSESLEQGKFIAVGDKSFNWTNFLNLHPKI